MIELTVNGQPRSLAAAPMSRLLDVLREELGLTGTKEGCGEGECGACAVLLDGELVVSCLVPVGQAAGAHVRTVEGLATEAGLAPVQQAFLEHGGAQCGICTPGMLLAALSLLERTPRPGGPVGLRPSPVGAEAAQRSPLTEADVRAALAGNLCRCTGYTRIIEAVLHAR